MNKKILIVIISFVLLLCSFVFLNSGKLKDDTALKNSIIKTVQKSNELDFAKVTNFKWDQMYVFTPYSKPEDVLKTDGIVTSNSNFSIEMQDNIVMIGFVKSNKLVAYVNIPQKYVELHTTIPVKFTREEAKFNILPDKKVIVINKK